MTPFWQDDHLTLYGGDCRAVLAEMPAESVHCVVTSPPYWGLRDYGTATWDGGDPQCDHKPDAATLERQNGRASTLVGTTTTQKEAALARHRCKCGARRVDSQLGLEPTPEEYVANMVAVFREVRRVLRADGTLWLNLGSSYNAGTTAPSSPSKSADVGGWTTRSGNAAGSRRVSVGAGASGRSPSRQPERAPAYGSDGTGPLGSSGPGSACSDLCDGCLADYLRHPNRTPDTLPPLAAVSPLRTPRGRDSEPPGSAEASPDASLPDAPASTTLRSWLLLRGPCSRCDGRAASLSGAPTSVDDAPASAHIPWLKYTSTLKPKDMVPIPWMVAMALQADGWYLRSDIIWSKPNPMPESVTDRPTKAHEYLFLLSKSPRYYFDADAVREADTGTGGPRHGAGRSGGPSASGRPHEYVNGAGRNLRSVWTIATEPYPGAHFATFPRKLVEPCVKAGSPLGGLVLDPFAGSGTTLLVAQSLGRRGVGIDLNPEYLRQALERNRQTPLGLVG